MEKIKQVILFTLLSTLASSALADDLLDRLETATEKLGQIQGQLYIQRVPELANKLPDWNWDEEIRAASLCVLNGIRSQKTEQIALDYVSGLEQTAKAGIDSLAQLNDESYLPKALRSPDETIFNLMTQCGTFDISANKMRQSGLWDALQNPKIVEKLIAN